jgi:hypothetical protein
MYTHPDLMSIAAKQHLQELAEEASKYRLAAALRRGRRQRSPAHDREADHGIRRDAERGARRASAADALVALDRKATRDSKVVADNNIQKVRDDSKSVHPAAAGRLG